MRAQFCSQIWRPPILVGESVIFGFQKILYYGKNIFHETEILWFETMAGKCLLHINSGMKYPTDNPLTLLTLLGIPVTC